MPTEGFQSRPTDAQLTIVTLGGWGVFAPAGSAPVPPFGPSKPLALLVYLALSPGRTAAREHLLDLLWADLEPDAATHAYRQTVWYIRQRLGEPCLKAGGNLLTLVARVETDRDAFLAAVARQDWERAVALYTGDFLPGFATPGGAEFERWADLERWRLRSLFVRAGEALARRHLATGHTREAVALARRVRDTDRSGEAGWRLLLEALVTAGDPVGAAVEADQLEQMLREDGRDPEPATRSLLRLARQETQESPDTATRRGLVAELIGREREFSAIVAAWDAVRRGASRHLHLTGAAGLGKSRLLNETQTRLRASGARTVLVRAAPGERTLSYALAADLAVALAAQMGSAAVSATAAGTLVGLGPGLAAHYPSAEPDRSAGDELLRRRALAMAELLAAVADEAPLALLIDDAHWMDTPSRQLVAALLGRLGRSPVLVVTTTRPSPEGALENADTQHLALEPLSVPEVGALVASFGALPDAAWARTLPDKLRAAAKGTPLLVLETLELAIERGILELGASGWLCPAPPDLEKLLAGGAALRQRLERLTREQAWLLLLLAVHGTPLPLALLRASSPRTDDALQADLALLEQRGLVSRERGEWQPAHDAIAELAIELAPREAMQAAHAALGHAVAADASGPDALPRAAQHFAAAGETDALNLVFRRWVRAARSRGDRRGFKALAQELLGHDANGRADALVRSLPVHLRVGVTTPARLAVLAGVLVVAAIGIGTRIAARNDVVLRVVGLVADGDGVRPVQIDVKEEDLLDELTIDVSRGARVPDLPPRISPRPMDLRYLGSGLWATRSNTGEPNGEEPTILGPRARLPFPPAPGDDAAKSASPDGRFVAVYTDRWSAGNAGDVGVFDLASGILRQLTSGPTRDVPGAWSPDGTRIAFERHRYDQKPDELCWVTFDGRRLSCFSPAAWSLLDIVGGWITPHEILALGLDSTGRQSVYSVNLDTRANERLFDASQVVSVPNSPWVVCACAGKNGGESEWQIRRVDIPGRAIHLAGAAALEQPPVLALPSGASPPPTYLDRLTIAGPPDSAAAPGVPFHYAGAGRSPTGSAVEVPVIEWRVADSTVATIDAGGVLVGKRPGVTTVYASAGGWRNDSVPVRIEMKRETTALTEVWDGTWAARWRPYGEPLPRVVQAPDHAALFVAGDSSYTSGVYSRDVFAADSGLGVRLTVRTPSPSDKWQVLHAGFYLLQDTFALRAWDHRTAALPRSGNDFSQDCEASYPGGEALWGKHFMSMSVGGNLQMLPVDSTLAGGRPWQLTLQLLPDGRCGLAVNGRVLRVGDARLATRLPRHVVVEGQSVRTRILVDQLEVWRGVRPDINWSRADSTAVRH